MKPVVTLPFVLVIVLQRSDDYILFYSWMHVHIPSLMTFETQMSAYQMDKNFPLCLILQPKVNMLIN